MAGMANYVAGVDLGSLFGKAVIIREDGSVVGSAVVRSGAVYEAAGRETLSKALRNAGLAECDLATVVATGYGRARIDFAAFQLSEITCHAKGMVRLFPALRTIIDIGGQDSKVIYVGERGQVTNFAMNDKCAAGCGRFLEVMADTLQVSLADLSELSLVGSEDQEISSMCTVFAESEVISLKAAGVPPADIAAAIHRSIARRVAGLVAKIGVKERVGMTGGVAMNLGMVKALERKLETVLLVPDAPQLTGAYGAALAGAERLSGDRKG